MIERRDMELGEGRSASLRDGVVDVCLEVFGGLVC